MASGYHWQHPPASDAGTLQASDWLTFIEQQLAPISTEDPQDYRERVRRELVDLDGHLAAIAAYVRRRWNSLQPVQKLPPELSETIFRLVRDDWMVSALPLPGSVPSWIAACSQVCHRWREIALAFSSLWSVISSKHYTFRLASQMIVRACSFPLTYLTSAQSASVALSSVVLSPPISDQLHSLHFSFLREHEPFIFSNSTLPAVQTLHLKAASRDPVLLEDFGPSIFPALKSLYIKNAFPSLTIARGELFLNLTELHVSCSLPSLRSQLDNTFGLDFETLLLCIPNIQALTLNNVCPSPISPPVPLSIPHIVLPSSLKRLALRFDEAAVSGFSSLITATIIPPNIDLYINVFSNGELSRLINTTVSTARPPRSLRLSFEYESNYAARCRAYYTSDPYTDADDREPITDLIICASGSVFCLPPLTDIPLDNVTRLVFEPGPIPEYSEEWWPSILSRTPSICELQLSSHDNLFPSAIMALSVHAQTDSPLNTSTTSAYNIRLPLLERLVLAGPENCPHHVLCGSKLEATIHCLEQRRAVGYPIRSLSLPSYLKEGAWTEKLRERVEKLTFGDELFI